MKYAKKHIPLLLQVVVWMLVTVSAFGQAAQPKPMSDAECAELASFLQSRLKQIDDLVELDNATKTKAKELYQQAIGEMGALKRWIAVIAQNERLTKDAPNELDRTREALRNPPTQAAAFIPTNAALTQLEQEVSKREAELERLRKQLADEETALKDRATRPAKLRELIGAANERLVKLSEQLKQPRTGNENQTTTSAQQMLLVVQRRAAEQEIICHEKALSADETRKELLPLLRDLHARQFSQAEQELKQWQSMVNGRRQQEAELQERRAAWEAGKAPSAVRQLAEENAKWAAMRKSLAECIVDATAQLERVNQKLGLVKEAYKSVKEKVEKVGLTNDIGVLLRKQREKLPELSEYRRNIGVRQQTIGKGELARLDLDDERKLLVAKFDEQVQLVVQNRESTAGGGNQAELELAIRDALKTKRDYLEALWTDSETYYKKLVELKVAEEQLIVETESFSRYIKERVLWIASTTLLGSNDVHCLGNAMRWLAGPDACVEIGRTLAADVWRNRALSILTICIFLLLLYWRMRFRVRVQEIGQQAARGSCYRFLPTLEAVLLTALIAAVWPGFLWYVGWRLGIAGENSELCKALGMGLTETARVFLALELLRHICCIRGLGDAHFGWQEAALKLLRHNLRWFSVPVLPLIGVAVAMAWQENYRWDGALGRICFIAALLCFSLVLHRVLRPTSVVFQAIVAVRCGGWLDRFRYVWVLPIILTPTALAVLAAVGYHYTARQLVTRLILTTYVIVGCVICRALLMRWTLVNQRKLAIEQARKRRAAQAEGGAGEDAAATAELPASLVPERDLATINIQTRRLVEYSLAVAGALAIWCAWVDVLPALSILNRIPVWGVENALVSVVASESAAKTPAVQPAIASTLQNNAVAAETSSLEKTEKNPGVITLADLCLAAIILATTIIAAKNIPGLLEMAVLQHLPFDAGARYAVATVCRYIITIAGMMFCCGFLGLSWSKVQWLVAAMTLGLGFGLQEIFANFVSGLIILCERPVRVGDVVTIEGVTGVVSRIRMRATTITDGDRKELIIPNKEFITGRVLNWTLTDPINRVVIRVNIAYGSDTQQAAEILLRLAKNHPNVLQDPPPGVSLESFGDSALNFVLRCFLPNMDSRGAVIHELHMAIDREFRAAGIKIAFPQQDVHIRSIDMPAAVLPPTAGKTPWLPEQKAA